MNKQELRRIYKTKRTELHSADRLRFDDLMLLQFQRFDFSSIQTLLTYWPIHGQAEPNTHLFSGYLRHRVQALEIAYPVMETATGIMTALAITEDTVYHTNSWGITEPKEGRVIDPQQVDLVLVPLLVCDKQGYRVGYGKGYYDRYLANCREDIVKIGLSYFEPIDQITDTGQFDVPLSYCITPQHCYEF